MLEKITAPISNAINAALRDGDDLEFISDRPARSRSPRDFFSCTAHMGIADMEKGYARIRDVLLRIQLSKAKRNSQIKRTVTLSRN